MRFLNCLPSLRPSTLTLSQFRATRKEHGDRGSRTIGMVFRKTDNKVETNRKDGLKVKTLKQGNSEGSRGGGSNN